MQVLNPQWFHRYKEPETTDEFVNKQGLVYFMCNRHLGGNLFIRYLLVGYIWVDEPTQRAIAAAQRSFPMAEHKFITSPCPVCKKLADRKLLVEARCKTT